MPRLVAIGDVHGQYTKLTNLVDMLELSSGDQVAFLGNLVGHGPQSADVVEYVMSMSPYRSTWTIMGQQEAALLDAIRLGVEDQRWLRSGGQQVIDSYGSLDQIPWSHKEFLKSTSAPILFPTTVGDTEYIASHAMLPPSVPLEESRNTASALTGTPQQFKHQGGTWGGARVLLFGHVEHDKPVWYNKNALCINTGARHDDRPLTAAIFPLTIRKEPQILQSDGKEERVYD